MGRGSMRRGRTPSEEEGSPPPPRTLRCMKLTLNYALFIRHPELNESLHLWTNGGQCLRRGKFSQPVPTVGPPQGPLWEKTKFTVGRIWAIFGTQTFGSQTPRPPPPPPPPPF